MSAKALINVDLRIALLREESFAYASEANAYELEQLLQERQKLIREMVAERSSPTANSYRFFAS